MKIDVKHVAKLANLPLSSEEENKFEKELSETLEYVSSLNEINTSNVPPADNITSLENVTREDVIKPSLSQKDALKNAKSTYKGFFKVKAVLKNE